MTVRRTARAAADKELREHALGLPEVREEFPWGERVAKVKGKVFVFLGREEGDFGISVKLPSSGLVALEMPFASPTGYGLGKSGWVTARFADGEDIPVPLLRDWIKESYCAVAPKKLAAIIAGSASAAAATKKPAKPTKTSTRLTKAKTSKTKTTKTTKTKAKAKR